MSEKELNPGRGNDDDAHAGPSPKQLDEICELYNRGEFHEAWLRGTALERRFPAVPFLQNMLGAVCCNLGRLDEGVAHYSRALQLQPAYPEASNNLGVALSLAGKHAEAAVSLREALRLQPDFAEAHNNLGKALSALGHTAEAAGSFGRALQLRPDFAEAHYNLGNARIGLGKLLEAAASYRSAVQFAPGFAEAHNNLGNVLRSLGQADQAIASYEAALRLQPGHPEAYNNLGVTLYEAGKAEEALASYTRAIELKPDYAEAHSNLGVVLYEAGRAEEALASYTRAIELAPGFVEAHSNRGVVLTSLGKLREAAASFEAALAISPGYATAHRHLSSVKVYRAGDPQLQQMLQLGASGTLSVQDRISLSFALGKAYGDLGEYDTAFSYLLEGNRLHRRGLHYDITRTRNSAAEVMSAFAADFATISAGSHHPAGAAPRPIFIVGMPRSGTTLVEQILASHSQVHGGGELRLLFDAIEAAGWQSGPPEPDRLRSVRESYLSGLAGLDSAGPYVTDKMPGNFWWVGFILSALPEARVINVRRDARATCWSIFKNFFPGEVRYAYDLRETAAHYRIYADLMKFWHERFPGKIHDIVYEDLIDNQEAETRRLLDYAGLGWEKDCLDFHRTQRAVLTASAAQVRRRLYRDTSQEWRRYEQQLQPLIELLDGL